MMLEMAAGKRVRMVKGPARVEARGRCWVVGCSVSDKTILVRAGKALPFEPGLGCSLYIKLGRGGRIWRASSTSAGVSMWQGVASKMLKMLSNRLDPFVLLVVGRNDAGKSTLCAYIANMALRSGYLPCIIDGDIGQGDLAPPSAIGAVVLTEETTDLRDLTASAYLFIGGITPSGIGHFISGSLAFLLKKLSGKAQVYIVNTDGYVEERGIPYKRLIADTLKPDLIVCLGEEEKLVEALLGGAWELQQARSCAQVFKSRSERISRRKDQVLRFIGNKVASAAISDISFVYMGETFSTSQAGDLAAPSVWLEDITRMFVGLGKHGQIVGFGMIMDMTQDMIRIQTEIPDFDQVHLSDIRLTE